MSNAIDTIKTKTGEYMLEEREGKSSRALSIYSRLMNGRIIYKAEEAERFGVSEKSIQRDIEQIRMFLDNQAVKDGIPNNLVYDYSIKGYRIEQADNLKLSNGEILAICKILLDSRAFRKDDMANILEKLIDCCVPLKNQKIVNELISNERFHYVPPRHNKHFIDSIWKIGQAIKECNVLEITYKRLKEKKTVKRRIQPLGIMFSEYYFYLTAFIDEEETKKDFDVLNDAYPTIYRIDRIIKMNVLDEKYHIPYSSRFEEGEFRKRVQFMYGGKLQRVKFKYTGSDIDAILDRLPTAKILSEDNEVYIVSAEVFGKGIDMWLKSQEDNIQIL